MARRLLKKTSMRSTMMLALICSAFTPPADAATPDAALLAKRMKAALEPARPSARRMTFRVSNPDGDASEVIVGQARRDAGEGGRVLTVVLAPASLRGTAYLVQESRGDRDVQWLYLPAIGRVRKIVSAEAYAAFLNSDFTYADLGFVDTRARYTLLGEETHAGTPAYRIEGVPQETWYVSRSVSWVAADSGLPLERDVYDSANQLWKIEHWEAVSTVNGVPTAMHVSMEDVPAKTRTDVDVSAVRYDVEVPEGLLDPAGLPKAAEAALWTKVEGPARP